MVVIGIIDDNEDQRESFRGAIELYIEKSQREGVEIVDIEPLEYMDDYLSWISQHDISALIIDEKLTDGLMSNGKHCTYQGHEMANFLRGSKSILPIHVVTSAAINEDLIDNRKLFENVLSRYEFLEKKETWAEIIIRSAQRFYKERKYLLERIGELSKRIAKNEATEEDIKEIRGLHEYFQEPAAGRVSSVEIFRKLEDFQLALEKMAELNDEAEKFLKDNS